MRKINYTLWTREDAFAFCRLVEEHAPSFGCHVALTGSHLYGSDESKDCDIVLYRELYHEKPFDLRGLFKQLEIFGVKAIASGSSWSYQLQYRNKCVDCFVPEHKDAIALDKALPAPAAKTASEHFFEAV